MFACCDIVAFFGGLPPAFRCLPAASSCGASVKGATWRCPAYMKISRLKAHRVAADSKRQCRQLLEYPAHHIIIHGVSRRTARKAAQSRGRVSTGATLATCCRQLQLQHMLLSASSNMLSSCCMRRFLSLISIAIAIVARVSAIRSPRSPHSPLSSCPPWQLFARVALQLASIALPQIIAKHAFYYAASGTCNKVWLHLPHLEAELTPWVSFTHVSSRYATYN